MDSVWAFGTFMCIYSKPEAVRSFDCVVGGKTGSNADKRKGLEGDCRIFWIGFDDIAALFDKERIDFRLAGLSLYFH